VTDTVDPIPVIYGNPDIKEIILYALCRYDERDPRKTTPIMLLGKSGEGKSAILEAVASLYKSKIFTKDGLTEPSLSGLGMSRRILCLDELSKWSLNYLSAVLIVFSHSTTERGRKAKQQKVVSNGLPVGTLLDTWQKTTDDLKGIESKEFIIAQLMRRGINLWVQPTTTDPVVHKEYISSVVDDMFGLESHVDKRIADMKKKMELVIERAVDLAQDYPDIKMEQRQEIIEYIDSFRGRVVINELVSYDSEFPKIFTNLSIGRAMAHGRHVVTLDDFKAIGDIVERHAKMLKFWITPPPKT
jgi:energy-coupling factor transporter ATP-binding protein EcfA2